MKINIEEIRIDGGTQSRVEINQQVVADYVEAIKAGVRMPPVSLYFDGAAYWLVDGFHRYHAHNQAGKKSIDAESKSGTQREAVLYSVGANSDHGLRRSNADKRKAVGILLADAEWSKWSDRQIAEACAVSNNFVSELRRSLSSDDSEKRIFTTKHGTQAVMNTANIGKNTPPAAPDRKPETPGPSQPETGQSDELQQEKGTAHVRRDKSGAADPATDELEMLKQHNEELRAMNREQATLLESFEADDTGAELVKQAKLAAHYLREVNAERDKNARLIKERDQLSRWQGDIIRATGAESPKVALLEIRKAFASATA